MRTLATLLLVVGLIGCKGEKGDPGGAGVQGAPGEKGATGATGTTGKDGVGTKTTHVVVTATGEDLGYPVGSGNEVFSPSFGGVLRFDYVSAVLFAQADCMGPGLLQGANSLSWANRMWISPSLTVLKVTGPLTTIQEVSWIERVADKVVCHSVPASSSGGYPFQDTGMSVELHQPSELTIELR